MFTITKTSKHLFIAATILFIAIPHANATEQKKTTPPAKQESIWTKMGKKIKSATSAIVEKGKETYQSYVDPERAQAATAAQTYFTKNKITVSKEENDQYIDAFYALRTMTVEDLTKNLSTTIEKINKLQEKISLYAEMIGKEEAKKTTIDEKISKKELAATTDIQQSLQMLTTIGEKLDTLKNNCDQYPNLKDSIAALLTKIGNTQKTLTNQTAKIIKQKEAQRKLQEEQELLKKQKILQQKLEDEKQEKEKEKRLLQEKEKKDLEEKTRKLEEQNKQQILEKQKKLIEQKEKQIEQKTSAEISAEEKKKLDEDKKKLEQYKANIERQEKQLEKEKQAAQAKNTEEKTKDVYLNVMQKQQTIQKELANSINKTDYTPSSNDNDTISNALKLFTKALEWNQKTTYIDKNTLNNTIPPLQSQFAQLQNTFNQKQKALETATEKALEKATEIEKQLEEQKKKFTEAGTKTSNELKKNLEMETGKEKTASIKENLKTIEANRTASQETIKKLQEELEKVKTYLSQSMKDTLEKQISSVAAELKAQQKAQQETHTTIKQETDDEASMKEHLDTIVQYLKTDSEGGEIDATDLINILSTKASTEKWSKYFTSLAQRAQKIIDTHYTTPLSKLSDTLTQYVETLQDTELTTETPQGKNPQAQTKAGPSFMSEQKEFIQQTIDAINNQKENPKNFIRRFITINASSDFADPKQTIGRGFYQEDNSKLIEFSTDAHAPIFSFTDKLNDTSLIISLDKQPSEDKKNFDYVIKKIRVIINPKEKTKIIYTEIIDEWGIQSKKLESASPIPSTRYFTKATQLIDDKETIKYVFSPNWFTYQAARIKYLATEIFKAKKTKDVEKITEAKKGIVQTAKEIKTEQIKQIEEKKTAANIPSFEKEGFTEKPVEEEKKALKANPAINKANFFTVAEKTLYNIKISPQDLYTLDENSQKAIEKITLALDTVSLQKNLVTEKQGFFKTENMLFMKLVPQTLSFYPASKTKDQFILSYQDVLENKMRFEFIAVLQHNQKENKWSCIKTKLGLDPKELTHPDLTISNTFDTNKIISTRSIFSANQQTTRTYTKKDETWSHADTTKKIYEYPEEKKTELNNEQLKLLTKILTAAQIATLIDDNLDPKIYPKKLYAYIKLILANISTKLTSFIETIKKGEDEAIYSLKGEDKTYRIAHNKKELSARLSVTTMRFTLFVDLHLVNKVKKIKDESNVETIIHIEEWQATKTLVIDKSDNKSITFRNTFSSPSTIKNEKLINKDIDYTRIYRQDSQTLKWKLVKEVTAATLKKQAEEQELKEREEKKKKKAEELSKKGFINRWLYKQEEE